MKKVFAILFTIIMLFSMAIPAYAALPDPPASPQFTYITSYDVDLTINRATGTASCSATCHASNASRVEIEYKLQQYTGSYWKTIKTWTSYGTTSVYFSNSSTVTSGNNYRGKATYRVYDSSGKLLESGSASETYAFPSP